jgi:hypothetical protein
LVSYNVRINVMVVIEIIKMGGEKEKERGREEERWSEREREKEKWSERERERERE